jgi:hypothetical protein
MFLFIIREEFIVLLIISFIISSAFKVNKVDFHDLILIKQVSRKER